MHIYLNNNDSIFYILLFIMIITLDKVETK